MEATPKVLKNKTRISDKYNKPNLYGKEGVDHINIHIRSKLKLGRILDPSYCCTIEYPHIGTFKSALALGYWLRSDDLDDRIRKLAGQNLKRYASDNNLYSKRIPNYAAITATAVWLQIKNREDILDSIKQLPSDIAILSYYTHKSSDLRITTNYAPMAVAISTEIISAVKENREPDFRVFATDKDTSMDYLGPVMSTRIVK